MQENNKLINNIDNINTKIRKILENNLTANLIIIFIGLIASTFITAAIFILMNNRISKFIIDSEYNLILFIPFFHLFYFFSLSLIFYINKNFNLKNILITFLSVVFILVVDLSSSFFVGSIDDKDFFAQTYVIKYIYNNIRG